MTIVVRRRDHNPTLSGRQALTLRAADPEALDMTLVERVGFLVFISATVTIFVGAAGVFVRLLLERFGNRKPPTSSRVRVARRVVLLLAALGVFCVAYGALVEPYWPEVTHVHIETAKLPAGSRPIRILQISDVHSDLRTRLEDRIPQIAAEARPDAIVFTGDATNSRDGVENFRRCMRGLAQVAPTYAVRGNWDLWSGADAALYADTGVRELNGSGDEIEVGDARVWICGVAVGNESATTRTLRSAPPGVFTVFLFHLPDEIYDVARDGRADLYCAGHTHGGQIALPFYGAIITLSRFGKTFESGLYRVESTWLYVNRGIGMEGDQAPRVRFCSRPEVTVFEIVPAS